MKLLLRIVLLFCVFSLIMVGHKYYVVLRLLKVADLKQKIQILESRNGKSQSRQFTAVYFVLVTSDGLNILNSWKSTTLTVNS